MGWFTKKDNRSQLKKPELPELPNPAYTNQFLTPSLPTNIENNTNELPPVEYPSDDKISPPPSSLPQKTTKEITNENLKPMFNEPRPGMQKSRFGTYESQSKSNQSIQQIKEPKPSSSSLPQIPINPPNPPSTIINRPQIPELAKPQMSITPEIKSFPKKDPSIFIKLDKFQITMEAFKDINEKVREIEDLLIKTKETKAREEKELEDWEMEIEAIKIKLDTIGKEISGNDA
jgi:hypothetical protein